MKKLTVACFILIVTGLFAAAPLQARPERVNLKAKHQKEVEKISRKNAGRVNLTKVQDPEARKAFKALFDTLNLKTQN